MKTREWLTDLLVRSRTKDTRAAGDTTFLCHGAIDICTGGRFRKESGKRVIRSVLSKYSVPKRRVERLIQSVQCSTVDQVAKFLVALRPYKETRLWLEKVN